MIDEDLNCALRFLNEMGGDAKEAAAAYKEKYPDYSRLYEWCGGDKAVTEDVQRTLWDDIDRLARYGSYAQWLLDNASFPKECDHSEEGIKKLCQSRADTAKVEDKAGTVVARNGYNTLLIGMTKTVEDAANCARALGYFISASPLLTTRANYTINAGKGVRAAEVTLDAPYTSIEIKPNNPTGERRQRYEIDLSVGTKEMWLGSANTADDARAVCEGISAIARAILVPCADGETCSRLFLRDTNCMIIGTYWLWQG